ncbi:MAG: hypothetical protein OEY23_25675 [Acidimicrobiia bacterium]|nr:hypothetical protein [Acidimicrobiia bacterium]
MAHGLSVPAVLEERAPAMRRFARALGAHHGISIGEPDDWDAAIRLATTGPLAVPLLAIDELPYLLEHSPELESVLQHVVDEARDGDGTRIVICGSSLSVMTGLLAGSRSLRGRADLELRLQPFDHRVARAYWGIDDPALAFRLDAVLGGLPGYRVLARSAPSSVEAFPQWLAENVLSPSAALYREAEHVLGEDRAVDDRAIHRSLVAAIAAGEHRPSRIAGRVGRAQTSLSTAFRVLIDAGFVQNDAGLLSGRDPLYRLADPIVRFLATCVDPWRPMIEEGRVDAACRNALPASAESSISSCSTLVSARARALRCSRSASASSTPRQTRSPNSTGLPTSSKPEATAAPPASC